MRKHGQLVEVINGVNKGKTGVAWNHEQNEKFGDRLAVHLHEKNSGVPVLIKIEYLKLTGYVN